MRKCPKCNKEYDDTWLVCLSDNAILIDESGFEVSSVKHIEKGEKAKPVLYIIILSIGVSLAITAIGLCLANHLQKPSPYITPVWLLLLTVAACLLGYLDWYDAKNDKAKIGAAPLIFIISTIAAFVLLDIETFIGKLAVKLAFLFAVCSITTGAIFLIKTKSKKIVYGKFLLITGLVILLIILPPLILSLL